MPCQDMQQPRPRVDSAKKRLVFLLAGATTKSIEQMKPLPAPKAFPLIEATLNCGIVFSRKIIRAVGMFSSMPLSSLSRRGSTAGTYAASAPMPPAKEPPVQK